MELLKIILLILMNINSYLFLFQSIDTIRFGFILSRTGAHSPSKLKQINSNDNIIYKDIFGYEWFAENELTSVGKRQHFYLGLRNNLEYKNKLCSENYHPKEILVYSSESNKTIQSSYAQLHGLYQKNNITLTNQQMENAVPPLNSDCGYINEKIELDKNKYFMPNNMQIVPVHTFYEKDHNYLLEKEKNCPNIQKFYQKLELLSQKKREGILNYKSKNTNDKTYGEIIIELLNEAKIFKDDYDIDFLKNNSTFFKIMAETFICEYFEAVNFDKFINKGINIYKLFSMFEEYLSEINIGGVKNTIKKNEDLISETYKLAKNVNYDLFNNLLQWLKIKVENDIKKNFDELSYQSPKLVLYISHHESVESLLYFLIQTFNIKNNQQYNYINFTSFISIELYRKNNPNNEYAKNDFYIKIIFDNEQIGSDISYVEFEEKIKISKISFEQLEEYCGFNTKEKQNNDNIETYKNYKFIAVILICIFPVFLAITAYLLLKNYKQNNNYSQFPEE